MDKRCHRTKELVKDGKAEEGENVETLLIQGNWGLCRTKEVNRGTRDAARMRPMRREGFIWPSGWSWFWGAGDPTSGCGPKRPP